MMLTENRRHADACRASHPIVPDLNSLMSTEEHDIQQTHIVIAKSTAVLSPAGPMPAPASFASVRLLERYLCT